MAQSLREHGIRFQVCPISQGSLLILQDSMTLAKLSFKGESKCQLRLPETGVIGIEGGCWDN